MATKSLIGVIVLICGLLGAGCDKDAPQAEQAQTNAASTETTAWWKTEGQATGPAAAAKLTGESLPGWKAYSPVNATLASKGKDLFMERCASCHTIGKGARVGPDLQGITQRDAPQWIAKFNSDPESMVKSDPHARELLTKYMVQMPNMHLKPDVLEALNTFFYQQDDAAIHGK